jgi:hypothetical protein
MQLLEVLQAPVLLKMLWWKEKRSALQLHFTPKTDMLGRTVQE